MKYYLLRKKPEAIGSPCRKTAYLTKEDAEAMINHIKETRVTKEIRAYKCTVCGVWHLSSSRSKY